MTTIRIQAIDTSAPGSFLALRERRRLIAVHDQTVTAFNDCVEAFNAQLEALCHKEQQTLKAHLDAAPEGADTAAITQRLAEIDALWTPEMLRGLDTLRHELEDAREAMHAAREAYEDHLITRLVSDDGTPVEQVLSMLSQEQWLALRRDDENATVTLPKHGWSS